MRLWKLTDEDGYTRATYMNATKWEKGKVNVLSEDLGGKTLCTGDVFHAYYHWAFAVLLNRYHGAYYPYRMWQVEGKVIAREGFAKCGTKEMKVLREVELPDKDKVVRLTEKFCRAVVTEFKKAVEKEFKGKPKGYLLGRKFLNAWGEQETYSYSKGYLLERWISMKDLWDIRDILETRLTQIMRLDLCKIADKVFGPAPKEKK